MPAAPGSPHSPGSPSKARGLKVKAVIKFGDRTSTLTIPCGDGKRTVRWLGVVAAQRFVLDGAPFAFLGANVAVMHGPRHRDAPHEVRHGVEQRVQHLGRGGAEGCERR